MKQKLTTYLEKLAPLKAKLIRYRVILFIVLLAGVYGYMLHYINTLANIEPEQALVDKKLGEVKRVKIDEKSIQQIEELEERNVDLEALFDNGRANPFQE